MHHHGYDKMRMGLRDPDRAQNAGHSIRRDIRELQSARGPALDDDVLLTAAQTRARVGGVSAMCIWRWMRDPRVLFPAPIQINRRNYWKFGDLRRWQAERATSQN